MRNAFSKTLTRLAKQNKNLILLTGDLGYTVFEDFIKTHPDRFINMGVAEANMMGVACGLSLKGFIPVVYSIATFATMRGFEQIRTDICVHNANVKIVGTGGGLSYGHAGSTHHALEDIAIMRSLPNMTIICPSDPVQAEIATEQMIIHKGPVYLRLGKRGEPIFYKKPLKFKIGKGIVLRNGKKAAIIATGNLVHNALLVSKILEKYSINITIVDMNTVKPLDKKLILQLLTNHEIICTLEEHSIIGGLGSAVAEVIAENPIKKNLHFYRFGLPDIFIERAGSQEFLRNKYSLTPEKISGKILKLYA
ncbi:1-deoxy-D-xylulose-5-phosphate synthase [Candidatus Gottesmanbacteria bacterium]|nr:1-deoxy-D-xylulose-5-phosphate synthase [Candidatus Gottesmanbacteria bacterium]